MRCPRLERVRQIISLCSGTRKFSGLEVRAGERRPFPVYQWQVRGEEALSSCSSCCILDISLKTPEERPDFVVGHYIKGSHSPRLRPKENSQIQPGPAFVELPAQAPHAQPAVQMRLAKSLPQLLQG